MLPIDKDQWKGRVGLDANSADSIEPTAVANIMRDDGLDEHLVVVKMAVAGCCVGAEAVVLVGARTEESCAKDECGPQLKKTCMLTHDAG